MLLSLAGCTRNREHVVTWAGYLGAYVVGRDYPGLMQMSSTEDPELENMMFAYTSDDVQDLAHDAIANTMSYKVDEESFKGGWNLTIDVDFEYVDYTTLMGDDHVYQDIDDFRAAVNECTDMKETVVNLIFEARGEKYVCTNISELRKVFAFEEAEFNFAKTLADYAGEVTFDGEDYDEDEEMYIDTDRLICELELADEACSFTWNYSFMVTDNGDTVYVSDLQTADHPDGYISAIYNPEEFDILPDGEYEISFYDENGSFVASGAVDVAHTEDSELTGTSYVSTDEPGQYVCPEGDELQFCGTDIVYELPEGFEFRDTNYYPVAYEMSQGNPNALIAYANRDLGERQNVMIFYIPAVGVDSDEAWQCGFNMADGAQQAAIGAGVDYDIDTGTIRVGGNSFDVWYFDASDPDGNFLDCAYIVIGNDEYAYCVGVCGEDMDQVHELIDGCFSVA